MNWLITGGCGFIGRNLLKRLMDEGGHGVVIIDNLRGGTREDLAAIADFSEIKFETNSQHHSDTPSAEIVSRHGKSTPVNFSSTSSSVILIKGDILDEALALKAAQGIDVIVHLAAGTGVGPSVEYPRIRYLRSAVALSF